MGACTVSVNSQNVIICPQRFRQNDIVFQDIARTFFGSIDNTMVFNEVKVKDIGSFDFVLVKHPPLRAEVEEFVVVEYQSDSTTGTGSLVENFKNVMNNMPFNQNYQFGMNTYNTIKLSFIQMLIKGQLLEHWGKNIVWALQDYVFSNLTNRFVLDRSVFNADKKNHFFLYNLQESNNIFQLNSADRYSLSVVELTKAFQRDSGLPAI